MYLAKKLSIEFFKQSISQKYFQMVIKSVLNISVDWKNVKILVKEEYRLKDGS